MLGGFAAASRAAAAAPAADVVAASSEATLTSAAAISEASFVAIVRGAPEAAEDSFDDAFPAAADVCRCLSAAEEACGDRANDWALLTFD